MLSVKSNVKMSLLSAVGVIGLSVSLANASPMQFIPASGFYDDAKNLNIAGLSDDGKTVVGTVHLTSSGDGDRAFWWKVTNGSVTSGLVSPYNFKSYGLGVSNDGATLLATSYDQAAGEQPRVTAVTNLGTSSQQTNTLLPGGATNTFVGPAIGNGMPISGDGKKIGVVVPSADSPLAATRSQYVWKPADNSVAEMLDSNASGIQLANTQTYPRAASYDGSVIVGQARFGTSTTTRGYRWTADTGYQILTKTGTPITGTFAVSDDGNTVAVTGGVWRTTTGYAAIPGYQSYGVDFTTGIAAPKLVTVAAGALTPLCMTADASWFAGKSNSAEARTGFIYSATLNQTWEITDFLASYGVDVSTFAYPNIGSASYDLLYSVNGLALNGNLLTILGETYGNDGSTRQGWLATVDLTTAVPEPSSVIALGGTVVLGLLRRRRSR